MYDRKDKKKNIYGCIKTRSLQHWVITSRCNKSQLRHVAPYYVIVMKYQKY